VKLLVKCVDCGELLATIEKPDSFTDEEINMYKESIQCNDQDELAHDTEITQTED
jgi:hypothetical protein